MCFIPSPEHLSRPFSAPTQVPPAPFGLSRLNLSAPELTQAGGGRDRVGMEIAQREMAMTAGWGRAPPVCEPG